MAYERASTQQIASKSDSFVNSSMKPDRLALSLSVLLTLSFTAPVAFADEVAAPRNVPFNGQLHIEVDATDQLLVDELRPSG